MSGKARKVQRQIAEQRLSTVCQVLTIMQNEADRMSWFQRLKIANSFLWKKNIDCFFQLAQSNRKKVKNEETI